jgi:hypothetical protein
MKRSEVLQAAGKAVADRGLNYGNPEDNFLRIARLWNAHLLNRNLLKFSYGVTEADVAIMLGQVKDARLANDPTHADSWIDKAGYAACGGEVSFATDAVAKYMEGECARRSTADGGRPYRSAEACRPGRHA